MDFTHCRQVTISLLARTITPSGWRKQETLAILSHSNQGLQVWRGGVIIPITPLSLYGYYKNTQISSFHPSPQCGWRGKRVLSRCWMTHRVAENRTGPVERSKCYRMPCGLCEPSIRQPIFSPVSIHAVSPRQMTHIEIEHRLFIK